jgi:hypothetical protein
MKEKTGVCGVYSTVERSFIIDVHEKNLLEPCTQSLNSVFRLDDEFMIIVEAVDNYG